MSGALTRSRAIGEAALDGNERSPARLPAIRRAMFLQGRRYAASGAEGGVIAGGRHFHRKRQTLPESRYYRLFG
jgi:hypothetical protein